MVNIREAEKSLKRFLKTKVAVTLAVVTGFLISGNAANASSAELAVEVETSRASLAESIEIQKELIEELLKENEKALRKAKLDLDETVRLADFYAKPMANSTQVVFSYNYINEGTGKDKSDEEWAKTLAALSYDAAGYMLPKGANPYSAGELMAGYADSLNAVSADLYDATVAGNLPAGGIAVDSSLMSVISGSNGVTVDGTTYTDSLDLGANITLLKPTLPVVNKNISVTVTTPNIGTIPNPNIPSVSAPTAPSNSPVSVTPPAAVTQISVNAPTIPSMTGPNKKKISFDVPATPEGYSPSMIVAPSKPGAPQVTIPAGFTPPTISFNGTGFGQGATIGMSKSNLIMENFDTYDTGGDTLIITTGASGTSWSGATVTATTVNNGLYSVYPVTAGTYYLYPGSTTYLLNAFINELRNHDATISGTYDMTDQGGGNSTKIFLSHNPAGVGNNNSLEGYHGIYAAGERTANFNGKLILHGITTANNTNVLVGVEHQLWNKFCHTNAHSVFNNSGEIILSSGNNLIAIMIDTEHSPNATHDCHKTKNTGKITINSQNSIGIDFGNYMSDNLLVDVSIGNIEVNGSNNYGLRMNNIHGDTYFDKGVTITSGNDKDGNATKIIVGGTQNVGISLTKYLSATANTNPIANMSNINIEVNGTNVVGFLRHANYSSNNTNDMILDSTTMGTFTFGSSAKNSVLVRSDKYGILIKKDMNATVGSTGNIFAQATNSGSIILDQNATLSSRLSSFTGLLSSGTAGAKITNYGTIRITGTGTNNVGMAILDTSIGHNSGIIEVNVSGGNNAGIYNKGTATVSGSIKVDGVSSSALYNEGTMTLQGTVGAHLDVTVKNGATGIYSKGGSITTASGALTKIYVDDTSNPTTRGLAVYADSGATISLPNAEIEVKEGAAGVASFGTGSNIDLTGAKLKYSGEGYAAYSDGSGTINLTNAQLELSGKATGVELDLNSPKVTLNNTNITMMSNDATVANLKNATNLKTQGLDALIRSKLGTGVTYVAGTGDDGTVYDKFKVGAVDGGDLTINSNMDKYSQTTTDDGFFYSRRFLGQRLQLTVDTGIVVTSSTDTAYASAYFNDQVVGLEMNSSSSATALNNTQINLKAGSKVIADRTNAGDGAIGLYINYGEVDINATATVEVEKVANIVNNKAIGVYAVNGSHVTNNGSVDVAGNNSIGVLGLSYREVAGTPQGKEFGSVSGQGQTQLTNAGAINLDGNKSVGMYMINNSADPTLAAGSNAAVSVTNSGAINMSGTNAAGIYAEGNGTQSETTVSNTGNINLGTNGVGIYATNGVTVSNLGNMQLADDTIGIAIDKTSTITDTTTFTPTAATGSTGNKTVVAVLNPTVGTNDSTAQTVNVNVDASALANTTSIYVVDRGAASSTITSQGTLKVGSNSVGVYVDNGHATNTGTIDLDANGTLAVGMYTENGTAVNNGTIKAAKTGQIGIVGKTATGKVENTGTINLNADGTTGIYVTNGASVTDSGATGGIVFGSSNSFGIAADAAHVTLNGGTYSLDNSKSNIYVYAKNGSDITIANAVTIDGVAQNTNKSVGIYLDGTNTVTNNNTLTAKNGSIGVYALNANTFTNGTYAADGDTSVALYMSAGGTLDGVTINSDTSTGNSIGLYAAGGTVSITNPVTLNVAANGGTSGTGMYFADGAAASGSSITLKNGSSTTNVGLYYKGAAATHASDINIDAASNQVVALYADGVATQLTNNATITDNSGKSVSAYVDNGATLTNAGTITANAGTGIYVVNGKAYNKVSITTTTGTGVSLNGTGAHFDGTGGSINVTGTGTAIALDGTSTGQVANAGTIAVATGVIGVYAKGSAVDFPVTITGSTGTGVYADGTSNITGTIDASGSTDTIAVYLKDNNSNINGATITTGSKGSTVAIGAYLAGTGTHSFTSGSVTANNAETIGLYVDNNTLDLGGTVNVGTSAVGIYATGATGVVNTTGGTINLGNSAIGVYVTNSAKADLGTAGALTVNFNGTNGILGFSDGGTINVGGAITIASGNGTLVATKDGSLTNSNTMSVSGGSMGLLGVYTASGTGNIENLATGTITVGSGSVGLAATGATGATPTVKNSGAIVATGSNATGMYADVGSLDNTSGSITVSDGAIGIYSKGASITNLGTITVTSGVGVVQEGTASALAGTVTLNDGTASQYSIGGYHKNISGTITLVNPATAGSYTIADIIDGGSNSVTGTISNTGAGTNQIALMATGSTTTIDAVTVSGDENIAVFGNNASLTINGAITANASTYSADKSLSSIAVYANGGSISASGQQVTAGDNSIGVYGKNAAITTGAVTAQKDAVGVFANGGTGVTVGAITVDSGSLGVYGTDTNITSTGNMTVAEGLAIGIVSQGTGDITYSGAATVADKVSGASIAIYKGAGQGKITTQTGSSFNVGKSGYAIYADNKSGTGTVTIENNAAITLKESAVGIYAGGNVILSNKANITVGATNVAGDHGEIANHLNSVGIYAESGAQVTNEASKTIKVHEDHSVGIYATGTGTSVTNKGTIDVDQGGVGILANHYATVVNEGTVKLGANLPSCGGSNTGIAAYTNATVTNAATGTINVGGAGNVGVYLGPGATFNNYGYVNIDGGTGVSGQGKYVNYGGTKVVVTSGKENVSSEKGTSAGNGAITISDTSVIVNNQYVHVNGTLETTGDLVLDGATVIVNTNNNTTFKANAVSGNITLDPSFATVMDNGYAANITGISISAAAGGKVSITTSPLFMAAFSKDTTAIAIAKQPYAYLVKGDQYDNLYNGIDSLLAIDQEGLSASSQMLKQMNAYLESVYQTSGEASFKSETARMLAEMRGDIYATIKGRMNRVEASYDRAFEELLSSYNFSRDTGKYSVIYDQGKYEDDTVGIDDYEYRTQGLLYMKEFDSRDYGSKYGYTLGFAASRFDFDDAPTSGDKSKEDIYSFRVGGHNVLAFGDSDDLRLVSKLGAGYNRHQAERTIELDSDYKNKAGYNSYEVSFDNRLEGTVFETATSNIDLYGGVALEYAAFGDFTETAKDDSGLELDVKGRDYFSAEGAVGIKGQKRLYLGKKLSAKLAGDISYAYEFGDNYGRTTAKVANGTEGYYDLIKPDEDTGKIRGKVGITLEKRDHYGVTADVELSRADSKVSNDIRYGIKFNYKFGGGR